MNKEIKNLTPKEIVELLDKYIVGQNNAKKNVAIALRNRWRRMNVDSDIQGDIMPNNILMIGSTGVGKTEIARRLAKITGSPFIKVEASKFTEVGYVGRDVESMVRDLVEQSVSMVTKQKKEKVKEKAKQRVEDLILDKLIPPILESKIKSRDTTIMPEEEDKEAEAMKNAKTREYYRNKLVNGELEDRKIDVEIGKSNKTNVGILGGGMIDEVALGNIQDALSNMMSPSSKKRNVTIKEARKILIEEEASKMVDMDTVKEEAIRKAQNTGIIFIDEIDKIAAGSKKGGSPDVSREGVQRDLLPIVEGSAVNTKYGTVNTDHILFISAGAFHVAKPSDLIPELQGRFPIRVELDSLTKADFYRILKEPKNALLKQYIELFKSEKVDIKFEEDAVEEIAEKAFTINQQIENIGARRLHTVMSHILNDFLFEVPDIIKPKSKIKIDKKLVNLKLEALMKNKDLGEYIL